VLRIKLKSICQDVLKCATGYTLKESYFYPAKARLLSYLEYTYALKVVLLAWAAQKLARTFFFERAILPRV